MQERRCFASAMAKRAWVRGLFPLIETPHLSRTASRHLLPQKGKECAQLHLPRTHRLSHGRVEAIPDVDGGNRKQERGELRLVEMLDRLFPDRIRNGFAAV